MGSFANSMFSVLLGWIRTAAGWLWNAMFNADDGGLIAWIGENWQGLIIALCVICLAIDFVIHILRWRPYKVWASFLRRLLGKGGQDEPAQFSGRMSRVWHYADGTAREEEVVVPEEEWYAPEEDPQQVSKRVASRRYARTLARTEKLKYQEELKKEQPVKGLEDYPQPRRSVQEAPVPQEEEPRMERLRKRMARLTAQQDEEELQLRYRPAPPAVDKREAYRAPYYPPQWKMPANEEETHDNAL